MYALYHCFCNKTPHLKKTTKSGKSKHGKCFSAVSELMVMLFACNKIIKPTEPDLFYLKTKVSICRFINCEPLGPLARSLACCHCSHAEFIDLYLTNTWDVSGLTVRKPISTLLFGPFYSCGYCTVFLSILSTSGVSWLPVLWFPV